MEKRLRQKKDEKDDMKDHKEAAASFAYYDGKIFASIVSEC